jgi:hypothetical protein
MKMKKNMYGQNQAGHVRNQYFHDSMIAQGFQQSAVDMFVYYQGSVTLLLYVDDGIYIRPSWAVIAECYQLMANHVANSAPRTIKDPSLSPPKWKNGSQIVSYLTSFSRHSQKVALVLNPQTRHVSPQLHWSEILDGEE